MGRLFFVREKFLQPRPLAELFLPLASSQEKKEENV